MSIRLLVTLLGASCLCVVAPKAQATQSVFFSGKSCVNILTVGGDDSNTSDNGTALTAAVTQSAPNPCVYFPYGTYKFTNSSSYTVPAGGSFTVKGDGSGVSILSFTSGHGGIALSYANPLSASHWRGLTVATLDSAGGQTGISLTQATATVTNPANSALTTFDDVTLRGADGYVVADYWGTGVNSTGVSNINFNNSQVLGNSTFHGTGIAFGGSASQPTVVLNVTGSTLNYLNVGVSYGNYAQGVTIQQSNFVADNYCVNVPTGESGLDQLGISNSQFNCNTAGLNSQSTLPGILVNGNLIIVPASQVGIQVAAASGFSIMGNMFSSGNGGVSGQNGISITGWTTGGGIITANAIWNMGGSGIWLQAGSKNVNVQSNTYTGNGANVTNSGTSNTVGGGAP